MSVEAIGRVRQRPLAAIGLMAGAAILFTVMTIIIKYLSARYGYALQTLFRQAAGLLLIAPGLLRGGRATFATPRLGFMILRCTIASVGLLLSFYTFHALPLADANAFSFTRVLLVAPIAAVLLGETVGWRRGLPITAGFLGVLVISRPQTGSIHFAHLVALASAAMMAWTSVMVRSLTRDHTAFSLVAWWSVIGVVVVLPFAMADWAWPDASDLLLLLVMGGLGVISQWMAIKALEYADASLVMPVDYLRLVLAIVAGYLLFSEVPDLATWTGSAVIVGSSLWLMLAERRRPRPD